MVPLSWPGVKPRREKPMFMHTWGEVGTFHDIDVQKLALFMSLMFMQTVFRRGCASLRNGKIMLRGRMISKEDS